VALTAVTASGTTGPVAHLSELDPAGYQPHALHGADRIWSETNCYTDVWVEVLHALGCEPLAAMAFCLSSDFEGTQWSFFKPPIEDLRDVFGVEVAEMNVWRPVLDHLEEELALGRLLTVEVDSWYLPDTAGVSYRTEHVKTTVVPARLDRAQRVLRYFHGPGLFELAGEDFDGLFAPPVLPPYVELVRLDHLRTSAPHDPSPLELAARHLARRPATNPVRRLGRRLTEMTPWLVAQSDPQAFHQLAFGTCRQFGATAEVAAGYIEWLAAQTGLVLRGAADELRQVAEGAKTLQFSVARVARGRSIDLDAAVEPLADSWDRALDAVAAEVTGAAEVAGAR
jgi:hypothetical protein